DAKAPVAVLGLEAGTVAAYALPGQRFTFYEADPALKRLVADTDKYFSYISDARKRGADIQIRIGNRPEKVQEDKDRKYALILVDQAESFPHPTDVFTREAVQLYFDRMAEDGILALHISNRELKLEPVVSAIARDLKLTGRIWDDDAEKRPGKVASSWVVLARKPEHLGSLYSPLGDLVFRAPVEAGDARPALAMDAQLWQGLATNYELAVYTSARLRTLYRALNEAEDPGLAWLDWALKKYADVCDPDGAQRLRAINEALAKDGLFTDLDDALMGTARSPKSSRLFIYGDWIRAKLREPAGTPEK